MYLGEHTLVLELDDQYYLCSTRDFATAVGTKTSGDQTRYKLHKRARIFILTEGVDKCALP